MIGAASPPAINVEDGRRDAEGERHGHRPVAGRRHGGHQYLDAFDANAPGDPAERPRLLGDSVRSARRQDAAHRRRRQRAGTQTTYFVYGTTGQNRPMVEGINSTEGTGAFGNYVDYGSFEEVSIGSGASQRREPVPGRLHAAHQQERAATGTADRSTAATKSGDWQSYNIDAAQIAAGVTAAAVSTRGHEPPGQLPRSQRATSAATSRRTSSGSTRRVRAARLAPSATSTFRSSRTRRRCATSRPKVTYQLSQNNQLVGYYQPSTKVQYTRLDRFQLGGTTAIHTTDDSSFRQDYHPLACGRPSGTRR